MAEIANNSIDIQVVETGTETAQYFWHNTVDSGAGEGAGAHITELPKGDFVADPANGGANTLIDSTTMHIRDGITDLAEFSDAGLTFTARNGQETFSIACDNSTTTDNVNCYTANRNIIYNTTSTATFPRLKTAATGDSIYMRIQYSILDAGASANFTKGTAETKTFGTTGVSIAYDGDYTFTATNNSSNSYNYFYSACRFSKTWYGTEETLHGNATIDGNADIYNDMTVGGVTEFCSAVKFGNPDGTFMVADYDHAYSNISSGGNMNWSETVNEGNGWFPIGVVGFNANRATLVVDRAYISDAAVGTCTINMHARAVAAASANDAHIYVLWVRIPE